MTNLLDILAGYLADKLGLSPGIDIFYNSMPDEPEECLLIQEPQQHIPVPAQVNASSHYLRFTARGGSNSAAYDLITKCYQWMMQDDATYEMEDIETLDFNGFIDLPLPDNEHLTVFVQPYGTPIWEKTDQQGRRYYYFTASLITKRII